MNRQRCKLWEGVIEGSQEGAVVAREKNSIRLNPKMPTTVDIILASIRVSICAGHNYGDRIGFCHRAKCVHQST